MRIGAAYIRVSTEDQVEYSPDSQLKKIREYAHSHDISLPKQFIFLDEGISGRHAEKRPAFMRMIGAAKSKPKPFEVILLWKFSRFARNRQDSILYKSMLRKECGIDVVSITEQLSDDPTAILIEALLEAMDEYYSINLAQEVRRGMNEKFSRGGVVSIPPFGYRMGETHFEPDEDKAGCVRMIYSEFLNGVSYRQIAARLNRMGVRSNRGNLFESRTVEYILSNPTYLGKLRRNPNGADRGDRFHQGAGVIVVEGEHEPIVSAEVFDAVQQRIRDLKRGCPERESAARGDFMLRGLVRCGSCGSVLTQVSKGKALQCHKYAKGQCEKSHFITMEKLNRAVLTKLEEDRDDELLLLESSITGQSRPDDLPQVLLEGEYKRLERAKEAYQAGIDSLEEYRKHKLDIQGHIQQLKQETRENYPWHAEGKGLKMPLKQVLSRLNSQEICEGDKNALLRCFVSKIIFSRDEGTIEIYYYL